MGPAVWRDDQLPALQHGQDEAVHQLVPGRLHGRLLPGGRRSVVVCRGPPALPGGTHPGRGERGAPNDESGN